MAVRWSRVAPQLALTPAVAVTLIAFFGAIVWTIYLSFSASRRFPDYEIVGFKQYIRLFRDGTWLISLENVVIYGIGSLASIVLGFLLAALIDKEVRGEGIFRTVFLYPLAVSLIVTGLIWRWIFNPSLGVENFLHQIGWVDAKFNWLARLDFGALQLARLRRHGDVRHHPRLGLAIDRLLHGADAVRTEVDQCRDLAGGPPRRGAVLAPLFRGHHPDDEADLPHLRHPAVDRRCQGL